MALSTSVSTDFEMLRGRPEQRDTEGEQSRDLPPHHRQQANDGSVTQLNCLML
ncbi:hypothetical protein KIN20_022751 [Parelaphostrongylus tenuis]|uniref:Uncharacterized protein n=1 Tax=Parelaphostrongylus tenuis TaxID=148309 RepID=A0AAD5N6F3_PARTN|nr:hypothetical protein KIN20_022751 [Parelaphostrongylus tenuis]